jgi:hypothetical protein
LTRVDELGANHPASGVIKRSHPDGCQAGAHKLGLAQFAFVPFKIMTATAAARQAENSTDRGHGVKFPALPGGAWAGQNRL